jgi:hypothetical protein
MKASTTVKIRAALARKYTSLFIVENAKLDARVFMSNNVVQLERTTLLSELSVLLTTL